MRGWVGVLRAPVPDPPAPARGPAVPVPAAAAHLPRGGLPAGPRGGGVRHGEVRAVDALVARARCERGAAWRKGQ